MSSRPCGICGTPTDVPWLICRDCGKGLTGSALSELTRRHAMENQSTAFDLTDQQWYNVCKFFPTVAARSRRERFEVSPDHPLEQLAKRPFAKPLDPKQWARDLVARYNAGERLLPVQIDFAHQALGLTPRKRGERQPGEDDQ